MFNVIWAASDPLKSVEELVKFNRIVKRYFPDFDPTKVLIFTTLSHTVARFGLEDGNADEGDEQPEVESPEEDGNYAGDESSVKLITWLTITVFPLKRNTMVVRQTFTVDQAAKQATFMLSTMISKYKDNIVAIYSYSTAVRRQAAIANVFLDQQVQEGLRRMAYTISEFQSSSVAHKGNHDKIGFSNFDKLKAIMLQTLSFSKSYYDNEMKDAVVPRALYDAFG
nr:uncharacterized protein CTRU02_09751 [Colletotrichum truncatum]KAF6787938.1 hypothetical protein CTRU02_09751 [Colletotrichum truncatum]